MSWSKIIKKLVKIFLNSLKQTTRVITVITIIRTEVASLTVVATIITETIMEIITKWVSETAIMDSLTMATKMVTATEVIEANRTIMGSKIITITVTSLRDRKMATVVLNNLRNSVSSTQRKTTELIKNLSIFTDSSF